MRSVEDKKLCYQENNSTGLVFEFHQKASNAGNNGAGGGRSNGHRSTALGKLSAPSKWDDAQKWLVGFSRGGSGERTGQSNGKSKPRNSNADDLRLIAAVPMKEQEEDEEDEYYSSEEEEEKTKYQQQQQQHHHRHHTVEKTKTVDASAAEIWRVSKPAATAVRSVCVRDMGTEMTPIASQEPSRTATPVRATTPVARSPVASGSSTPIRPAAALQVPDDPARGNNTASSATRRGTVVEESSANSDHNSGNLNPLETRAVAWDEAERAKYMARFKREEVKIQAWENHEKRKAEMEMKKMEVKAERMKARAEEKMANKLAATRRIAEEKRANAEATLNEKAVKTSERADYIRRTGHLPSSFSFKLPSLCW